MYIICGSTLCGCSGITEISAPFTSTVKRKYPPSISLNSLWLWLINQEMSQVVSGPEHIPDNIVSNFSRRIITRRWTNSVSIDISAIWINICRVMQIPTTYWTCGYRCYWSLSMAIHYNPPLAATNNVYAYSAFICFIAKFHI